MSDLHNLLVNSCESLLAAQVASGDHQLVLVHGAHHAVFLERLVLVALVVYQLQSRGFGTAGRLCDTKSEDIFIRTESDELWKLWCEQIYAHCLLGELVEHLVVDLLIQLLQLVVVGQG